MMQRRGEIQTVEMEESSRRGETRSANMTVIKHTTDTPDSCRRNTCVQSNPRDAREEESHVSVDEETEGNNLFLVDPESSHQSEMDSERQPDLSETESSRESLNPAQDKENRTCPPDSRVGHGGDTDEGCQQTDTMVSASGSQRDCESSSVFVHQTDDEEIFRRAKEEGRVTVLFPGRITQEGCCRFVCELLKFLLYQRQQLPMTYDHMVFLQKQHLHAAQTKDVVSQRPSKTSDGLDWRRCMRTLQDLDEVLAHLETLFTLSHVPRVLFMLGGSTILPTELYEINMEAVVIGAGENSLRTSTCLRQLFRTLFVADLLSDAKSVRLMGTTVMALGHRDCGVTGFKPKVDFRVPTKVKRQVICIASDLSLSEELHKNNRNLEDYIWFQAPVTVKGFCK